MGKSVRLILLFFVCFFAERICSQEWIPIDMTGQKKNAITIDVMESNQYTYKAKFKIHGIYDFPIIDRKEVYHQLAFGDGGHLANAGDPSLPTISQFIAIPSGATLTATLSDEKWSTIDVGKVYPAQKPCIGSDSKTEIYINESSYKGDFIPTKLSVSNEIEWRRIKCKNVVICPFKYYPKDGRLSVLREFTLQVNFIHHNKHSNSKVLHEVSDDLSLFANKVFIDETVQSPTRSNNTYDYLIIVGSGMNSIIESEKMTEFRIWKALKGHGTKVASMDTINNHPTTIKNFIADESENGVRYVLFVGDGDKITVGDPVSSNNTTINSDYWYGCLSNNDAIAEIPIGRFPTNTLSEFENMVDKTIKYERKYEATNKTLLVAHMEYAPQYFQNCCNQILNPNPAYTEGMTFIKAYGAPSIPSYIGGTDAKNDTVIHYINEGVHIINYRGHGGASFWGNPNWNAFSESFSANLISSFDNETCAIFFSVACQTGDFLNQTCMLETFLRSHKGAEAFIGATQDTDNDGNDGYNQRLFKELLNEGVYKLGNLNISAHSLNINNSSGNPLFKDVAYSYIVGGDPSLEIWTHTPYNIGDVNLTESNGMITIDTGLSGGSNVSISSIDGDLIQTLSPSGNTCTFSKPANQFYVSVYKHNYFPKIIYYDSVTTSIVNKRFDYDAYYMATPLDVHTEDATFDEDEGTIVRTGSKLVLKKGSGGVIIHQDFECEKGATLKIE